MATSIKRLEGLRILVVEDNFLAAEVIRDTLESSGAAVIGPVGRLEDGLKLAGAEALDGAVLDVNLNGDRCFPIAEALRQRSVPFIFLTGYDDAAIIPVPLQTTQRLGKPVLYDQLISTLDRLLRA